MSHPTDTTLVMIHNEEEYTDQAYLPWLWAVPTSSVQTFIEQARTLMTEQGYAHTVKPLPADDLAAGRDFIRRTQHARSITEASSEESGNPGEHAEPSGTHETMSDAQVRAFIQSSTTDPHTWNPGTVITGRLAALEAIYRTEDDLLEDAEST